ncbi:hypothetical protein L7F22_029100 [Adiantum nelumboides]|nr:hypothetical protein [Adiantum nelumboides]
MEDTLQQCIARSDQVQLGRFLTAALGIREQILQPRLQAGERTQRTITEFFQREVSSERSSTRTSGLTLQQAETQRVRRRPQVPGYRRPQPHQTEISRIRALHQHHLEMRKFQMSDLKEEEAYRIINERMDLASLDLRISMVNHFMELLFPKENEGSSKEWKTTKSAPNYTFVKEASEVSPLEGRFDYIIVGGGTAGCPLAATLSSKYRVLVLERGGVPYGNANITRLENFPRTIADDRPDSPAQCFVSTDGVISSRARVLGGSSCLNAGFYSRASPEYVAHLGWNGTLVNKSYPWVEAVVANVPIVQQWQSGVRNGLLEVGILPYNGQTFDHIEGTKVGGSIFDADGNRHTAADLLEYANPDNITVLIHANVNRVLFRTKSKYFHLHSFNISVLLDNSGVGAGMADNPMNAVFVPSPTPVETKYHVSPDRAASNISTRGADRGEDSGSGGPTQSCSSNKQPGYRRRIYFGEGDWTLVQWQPSPLSNGNLRLLTTNVSDNPAVTFNYFADPADLQACVQGIQTIEQVINSGSFADFRYPQATSESLLNLTSTLPINFIPKHTNDSTSLEQFCRDTVTTIWHYHGGSQVGRVVSPTYNVLGVDALRIIDGSTWNFSPGTNPQATVMMLGRYHK